MPADKALLQVLVTPRAMKDSVGPMLDGVLHVHVTRPPADGEATEAVRRLVARAVGVPRSAVVLVSGIRSRHKRFAVDGLSASELRRRLSA
jgi:uncharacterized protein